MSLRDNDRWRLTTNLPQGLCHAVRCVYSGRPAAVWCSAGICRGYCRSAPKGMLRQIPLNACLLLRDRFLLKIRWFFITLMCIEHTHVRPDL